MSASVLEIWISYNSSQFAKTEADVVFVDTVFVVAVRCCRGKPHADHFWAAARPKRIL